MFKSYATKLFDVKITREDDGERLNLEPRHTSVFGHEVIKIGVTGVAVGVGDGVEDLEAEGVDDIEIDEVINDVAVITGVVHASLEFEFAGETVPLGHDVQNEA